MIKTIENKIGITYPIKFIIKEENPPIFQIREWHNTYSVVARIYLPEKKFFEHPNFINLSYKDAEKACNNLIKNPCSVEIILEKWLYIGD